MLGTIGRFVIVAIRALSKAALIPLRTLAPGGSRKSYDGVICLSDRRGPVQIGDIAGNGGSRDWAKIFRDADIARAPLVLSSWSEARSEMENLVNLHKAREIKAWKRKPDPACASF
jgi:hypothetical protein